MAKSPALAATYAFRTANRRYTLDWRSTGAEHIVGRANVAKRLGIREHTLGVYIAQGKGMTRPNPVHGELDSVVVTAGPLPKAPKPAKPPSGKRRGRPRKPVVEMP